MLTRKTLLLGLLVLLALWWSAPTALLLLRGDEAQVLAAQEKLVRAAERRDWEAVKTLLAEDYGDDVGHDRNLAVDDARQALAHFFTLTLKHQVQGSDITSGEARLDVQIRLEGNGGGFSQTVVSTVNGMTEPWEFLWRKQGAWPWSWRVKRIHHPQLADHANTYR